MSETKHTPDPWKAVQGVDLHGDEDDQDPQRWSVLVDGPKEYFIATIENGAPGDTVATEASNACLFAVSPALLRSCIEMAHVIEYVPDLTGMIKPLEMKARAEDAIRRAFYRECELCGGPMGAEPGEEHKACVDREAMHADLTPGKE